MRGRIWSCVTDSFAISETRSWRSEPISLSTCARLATWFVNVSSWVVMATMPDTGAYSIQSIDPSPAGMVSRAWGDRLWTRSEESWRLFLVSAKISARKAKGGAGRWDGEREAGSTRWGVLAWEMAAAKPWLPGGMGGFPSGDGERGRGVVYHPVSEAG